MKRVSDKMKVKNAEYKKLRLIYLNENPICEACKDSPAQELHHKSSRGINHNNTATFCATCSACHRKIHNHPSWARENGFLVRA